MSHVGGLTMDEAAARLTLEEAAEWAQFFKEEDDAHKKAKADAKRKSRSR